MRSYLELARRILDEGEVRHNRTGVDTIGIFGAQIEHDLSYGFPLLTTKKIYFQGVVAELLWFLRGETNIKLLNDWDCKIWDEWADEDGELGPIYGHQWRSWEGQGEIIDQIKELIDGLRYDPHSRRHIVTAWNPVDVPKMKLPPCHVLFQCYVTNDRRLNLHWYQRSLDFFLGAPFNLASYSLLVHLLAMETGLSPGKVVWSIGDCHTYTNHLDQIRTQLARPVRTLPQLSILPSRKSIFDMEPSDIMVENYFPHPTLKGEVAV